MQRNTCSVSFQFSFFFHFPVTNLFLNLFFIKNRHVRMLVCHRDIYPIWDEIGPNAGFLSSHSNFSCDANTRTKKEIIRGKVWQTQSANVAKGKLLCTQTSDFLVRLYVFWISFSGLVMPDAHADDDYSQYLFE